MIAEKILQWHIEIDRDLPWKTTVDPYFIWLSEIILQQTRVAQGTPYYLKFTKLFPTVHDLAKASQEAVFKAWEGLGYYSRARNLHAAAKFISEELAGKFPSTYNEILKLKGVGPYTAAAISSFAFNEDQAVLDGNVFRVLSRLFDSETDILSSGGKKEFSAIANDLLPKGKAAKYNQAIMDFGALFCTPQKPNCLFCPLQESCAAYRAGTVGERPVKKKAAKKKKRFFHILDTRELGFEFVMKREAKDVWQGLHQLPLIETNNKNALELSAFAQLLNVSVEDFDFEIHYIKQLLSHQEIHGYFYQLGIKSSVKDAETMYKSLNSSYELLKMNKIKELAFPRLFNSYFEMIAE